MLVLIFILELPAILLVHDYPFNFIKYFFECLLSFRWDLLPNCKCFILIFGLELPIYITKKSLLMAAVTSGLIMKLNVCLERSLSSPLNTDVHLRRLVPHIEIFYCGVPRDTGRNDKLFQSPFTIEFYSRFSLYFWRAILEAVGNYKYSPLAGSCTEYWWRESGSVECVNTSGALSLVTGPIKNYGKDPHNPEKLL